MVIRIDGKVVNILWYQIVKVLIFQKITNSGKKASSSSSLGLKSCELNVQPQATRILPFSSTFSNAILQNGHKKHVEGNSSDSRAVTSHLWLCCQVPSSWFLGHRLLVSPRWPERRRDGRKPLVSDTFT